MIISVASGKGGTGKTLVSVNLALSLKGRQIQFLDCDVEEPNAYFFLKPEINTSRPINVLVPNVNEALCTHCKKCAEFCAYNAILVSPKKVTIFPDLCHSCGGCAIVCPTNAISESEYRIGDLKAGKAENVEVIYGELEVSKPLAVPVIKEVKKRINKDKIVIIDSPPGASCPVIEAVKGSDFCILVTEPTPFGLHDLTIAVEVLEQLKIPFGVVVNRADLGDRRVWEFCAHKNIPILLEIPYQRRIAELYSKAVPFVEEMPEWREKFQNLYVEIEGLINK